MKVSFLAIDVGNTHAHIGVFIEDKLTETYSVDVASDAALAEALAKAQAQLEGAEGACAMMASVNAPGAKRVAGHVRLPINRVDKDLPIPIGRQLDREALTGDDRLLNAAAAYNVLKQSCVIVDAGTAVTVDFVDGAGTFHGGAIAAGAQMQLKALHEYTAQLPQVSLDRPVEPIGHNTVEAMRSAVFHGLRGMVRELVEQYAEKNGAYPVVIATGGDAEMLFKDFELVERIVPELTMIGMAVTLRTALEQDE